MTKLFIWGSRVSLEINGELVSRLLSGGQSTTVRGLLASSPVADDHLFFFLGGGGGGLFEFIRFHPNPDALLAYLQLSPFSLVTCSPLSLGKPVEEADATRITARASPHCHAPALLCLESLSLTTLSNCVERGQIE